MTKPALVAAGVLGLAALLFAWRTQAVADNAIVYCLDAKRGTNLFHSHHVIFNAAIYGIQRVLAGIGVDTDTITVAQAHNACFAGVLIAAFALWLASARDARRFGTLELAAPLLLIGSSSFLEWATQPQSYGPALACAVVALAVLAKGPGQVRIGRAIVAAVMLSLAVLYHQISVVCSILLLAQALAATGPRRRPALREAGLAIVIAGGLTLGAYVAAHAASKVSESLFEYCTLFLHSGQPWGTSQNVSTAGFDALGVSLARATAGTGTLLAGRVALVAVALLLVVNVIAAVRTASSREGRVTCLVWASSMLVFLLWWLPKEVNYFLFVMPPIAALAMLSLRDVCGERAARPLAVTLAIAVVAWAFLHQVRPNHLQSNALRERAAALHAIGDRDHVRICTLATTYFLSYDFDAPSVIPVNNAMAAALSGASPGAGRSRPHDPLRDAEGIVIPLAELRPDLLAEALADVSPADPARPWLDFAAWLFDLRAAGAEGTRRTFDVRRMNNGELVVVISNRRVPCRDMDDLLQALDREVAAQDGQELGFGFAAWKRAAVR